jgi:hypothetical protein
MWAKIPYWVYYHIPRGRKIRSVRVWEDVPLSFRAPTGAEAPIAYRILRTDPEDDSQSDYDVRHFEGQPWWPVLDSKNARRAGQGFLNGLTDGEYFSLGIIHITDAPLRSSSKPTLEEALRNLNVRGEVRTSREEQLALARRGASETMICGGDVYVRAGEPMYFAVPSELPGDRGLSLTVGKSPKASSFLGYYNRVPGLHADARRRALFDANVFDVRNLDKDRALLEEQGFSIRLLSSVEILEDVAVTESALDICADAALSRLLKEKPIATAFLERIPARAQPHAATSLIPLEICREVLRDIVEVYAPDDQSCVLKDAILCARSVLRRLGPSLAGEDEEALSSLREW